MSEFTDDSIFLEFLPVLPTEPEQEEIEQYEAELITDKYYYLLSSPDLGDFSNAWKYLVNATQEMLSKWLEVGMPTYYNDLPFSISILTAANILQKNENVLDQSKAFISNNDYNLLDTYNSLLRIMIEGDYSDETGYIDVKLAGGETGINHFAIKNPLNGLLRDLRGNQDGQLIDSNCLLITDFANTKIRLPEIIEIDPTTLSKNILATAGITASGNEISFTSNGDLYQLEFEDTDGNSYEFPLCDRWINQDDEFSYLLHGIRYEAGSGTKIHVYAWYDGGSFGIQDVFHWMGSFGADVNVNQADTSQKIWTPKDRDLQKMYTSGVDDFYYLVDLLPIV